MGINIKNEEACELIRALAKAKGVGLTEAITEAVRRELEWSLKRRNMAEEIEKIVERIKPYAHLIPASDEIDDLLYDEYGLPK